MARFDVYRLVEGGLVVDLQADLLSDLATRVVAPLLPLDGSLKPASNLNPIFDVDGEKYMLGIQFLAAIPNRELQNYICSLSTEEQIMLKSIDMLFSGF
ncbi:MULTISPECIES: CcdB family protein [unclassified Marinobacterium]|jgi:toxin CcdB|uniref:CcdB family protein n=1 Tax=unclassified Marinobacterium TaxID=2644139 RepID=UPI00156A071D|nr:MULTISPECIES: CcdB family protein [unclassified Marinobacterium]NRP53015.1 CcdB protein [Marinobacterium sp. xm-v-242]NRP77596.1 CcdB protein [Marinobacterium sp. xm-m-383]